MESTNIPELTYTRAKDESALPNEARITGDIITVAIMASFLSDIFMS